MSAFEEFYRNFGLVEYPFSIFSAEQEKERLKDIFVKPNVYAPLVEIFGKGATVILKGERGTGKTALTYELVKEKEKNSLVVVLDEYSDLEKGYTPNDLYRFILNGVAEKLLLWLAEHKYRTLTIPENDRFLLAYLLKFHITEISQSRLQERIRGMQQGAIRTLLSRGYDLLRYPLNFAANIAVIFATDAIKKTYPGLPDLDLPKHKDYFPQLAAAKLDDISQAKANFKVLKDVSSLVKRFGIGGLVIVIDKIDENQKLENDAEEIADFLSKIVLDNNLLLDSGATFVVCSWSIPLGYLAKEGARLSKMSTFEVAWDKPSLEKLLNRRLAVFSGEQLTNYRDLFAADVSEDEINDIFLIANKNPRDLIHLLDEIFLMAFKASPALSKISSMHIREGVREFVSKFNFFEYYPRNSKSRANSMDVYSYIAHLLKLGTHTFTKNELNEKAGVSGSSAPNYVTAMKNMGLVKELTTKKESAVVYEIRDPKVVYAISNGMEISRP
ncbi:P-loop ATPase, Sll1717 family [Sideroxydans lithotrophicus]|uniref:Uncharacterized protein n=1 Tax=Sideroxydans lithotrophicus (strain ES-1) TaxID=580332 RepID=D5CR57_SIDLE|nr:hypothetical protein [Sideroxydans lithotrophicus]ADE11443.1 hypothetical protein Slit_1205 [Sideroxydans lithotrophicus ES-1]